MELNERLKYFRKVFTRYDKLDSIYIFIVQLAMIFDAILIQTLLRQKKTGHELSHPAPLLF